MFTSGYVNTETILHFFYKITNERGTKTVFTYAHVKWFYGQSERACYLNYFINLNTVVRSIPSQKFHSDLQHNTFHQHQHETAVSPMSFNKKLVFLQSCTAKNRFWLNQSRETCQNEWSFLIFDDKGLSTISKASVMPMTEKKSLFLIILNNIVYYTFFGESYELQ